MKDKYHPCFEEAFEKLKMLDQERSISGFEMYKSNLEKLLYLSIGDYNACLEQYTKMLDTIGDLADKEGISKESLKDHLGKIENVAEMIILLNGLKNVKIIEIDYSGDDKKYVFNKAKELTDKCFDKTINLTEKIENILKSDEVMDLTEEIIENEVLEFKENDEESKPKEYKNDLEKLWYENPDSLVSQLEALIDKSRNFRSINKNKTVKTLKKDTYEKFKNYKEIIYGLPEPNGNNSDLYKRLEDLKYKAVVELNMLFGDCKIVDEKSYVEGKGEIALKETLKLYVGNVEEIKIEEPLYQKTEKSLFEKKKEEIEKKQQKSIKSNTPWYKDKYARDW